MVQAELESRKSLICGRVSQREVLQGSSIMWIGESAVSFGGIMAQALPYLLISGILAMSNKILTACSNGNFMIFDTEKNRFGKQWSAVSLVPEQELTFFCRT